MKKGFTLLEVAIASGILTVAILGLLTGLQTPFILNDSAKETTIALKDAARVLEEIRITNFSDITTTNWTSWAQSNGLTHLTNEVVTVTTTGTDPLSITVEVQWDSRAGQRPSRTVELATRKTS